MDKMSQHHMTMQERGSIAWTDIGPNGKDKQPDSNGNMNDSRYSAATHTGLLQVCLNLLPNLDANLMMISHPCTMLFSGASKLAFQKKRSKAFSAQRAHIQQEFVVLEDNNSSAGVSNEICPTVGMTKLFVHAKGEAGSFRGVKF